MDWKGRKMEGGSVFFEKNCIFSHPDIHRNKKRIIFAASLLTKFRTTAYNTATWRVINITHPISLKLHVPQTNIEIITHAYSQS